MKTKNTIKEINGRYTCTRCGYEWSAMCGEGEIPYICSCQETTAKNKKKNQNDKVIEAIYIGDEFYGKSGSIMSSIYRNINGNLIRWDWGKVQISLSNGNTVKIRPANKSELDWAYAMLGRLMSQRSVR